jgi:hypothetical protein
MAVEYCIELYDGAGSGRGPGSKIAEVWDARNVGWGRYDRLPGKAFCTLYQDSPLLGLLDPLVSHVKITRVGSTNVEVYAGQFIDYNSTGDDVVCEFFDYVALLGISRSGFRTMYPSKLLGTEIVSPEITTAKNATGSPLGFITIGTIENPLGQDGVTAIKTNDQFGTLDQMRLQLFYDLAEMGRANTGNHVTFDITRTSPYTFRFLKNAGSTTGLGLVLNGNVSDYAYAPNWTSYRNDLATVGLNAAGGAGEITKTDASAITSKGLRQDVATLETLLGITGAATEADQQQAALARKLYTAVNRRAALWVRLVPGTLEPFVGWEVADRATVEIGNGRDTLTGLRRIVGVRALFTEAGEQLSILVEPTS